MKKREFVLYDLTQYKKIIEEVIRDLNASEYYFDIKLILTEALTNAYKHGNKSNNKKSIYLRYFYNNNELKFEIEDSGSNQKNITIPNEISDENLLDGSGRGLFLIKSMADNVEYKGNMLIIQKYLCY
ncbi:ATP-binding protein [Anaeromicrobium sediminis]|uniref:Anti-sigma regulatory factor n=1 Tax=Anaeromicrobium sediminis TaxID=1478221 RepID=A0A267MJD6_9FIRM|nr:ATP-binding protein [Anaeromicrobium sediminis]PAB59532.1 anti-sigma regulatory factor [Anaeromicrobium sediminis]